MKNYTAQDLLTIMDSAQLFSLCESLYIDTKTDRTYQKSKELYILAKSEYKDNTGDEFEKVYKTTKGARIF